MKNKSYIVEFAGLAGSGKTLIKNSLLVKLKENTCKFIFSNEYKVSVSDIMKWRSLIVLMDSLSFMFHTKQKTFYYFMKGLFYWFKIQMFYSIVREKGGLLIIDEGVFQKFRSIRRYSKHNEFSFSDIKPKLIKNIYLPDRVVLINACPEDIINRLRERDGTILENMKEATQRVGLTKQDIDSVNNVSCFEFNNSSKLSRLTKDERINNLTSIIINESGLYSETGIEDSSQ